MDNGHLPVQLSTACHRGLVSGLEATILGGDQRPLNQLLPPHWSKLISWNIFNPIRMEILGWESWIPRHGNRELKSRHVCCFGIWWSLQWIPNCFFFLVIVWSGGSLIEMVKMTKTWLDGKWWSEMRSVDALVITDQLPNGLLPGRRQFSQGWWVMSDNNNNNNNCNTTHWQQQYQDHPMDCY